MLLRIGARLPRPQPQRAEASQPSFAPCVRGLSRRNRRAVCNNCAVALGPLAPVRAAPACSFQASRHGIMHHPTTPEAPGPRGDE